MTSTLDRVTEKLALLVEKYNPRHFPPGSSKGGEFAPRTGATARGGAYNPGILLAPVKAKAWTGEQVELTNRPSKQEVGALGERIAIAYLQAKGFRDARPLNAKKSNYAVDMAMDHKAVEIKCGLASNGPSAQQWRATIGQPGKEETTWLKTASKEDKAAWNKKKQDAILARKEKAVKEVEKRLGRKVGRETVALIVNPDAKTADVYRFEGFHLRIGWSGDQAKSGYVGTFRYTDAAGVKKTLRELLEKKYNSTQPRVPAGNPHGGEWASGKVVRFSVEARIVEINEVATSMFKEWIDAVSNDLPGRRAISAYSSEDYAEVNKFLRSSSEERSRSLYRQEIQETVRDIDRVMKKASCPEDLVVYRGLRGAFAAKIKEGKTYTEKGYCSTTLNHKVAKNFLPDSPVGDAALLRIRVPKGAKAAYLNGLSAMASENEVLIARGTRYKIIGGPKVVEELGRTKVFDVEMLP